MAAVADGTGDIVGFVQLIQHKKGQAAEGRENEGIAAQETELPHPPRSDGFNFEPIREYYRRMIQVRERAVADTEFFRMPPHCLLGCYYL